MYDIRQFKPALYVLLLLGITGFAISAQMPGLWVVACFFVLLHAWQSSRGRFSPMRRLLTNAVTLGILAFVLMDALTSSGSTPVLLVGEFLVLLQLVKLWEQRGNRDYAQLLVLGLLMMVAAAISTASLWFGIIFLAYLFLSLYCCILFHLKSESEAAQAALGLPRQKFSPATLRQDQRYLPRSMWRLAITGTLVSIAFGVVVFVIFPRGATGSLLGPFQMRAVQALVGFSDEVNFQNIARIQQSNDTIAWVALKHNGKPVEGTTTLLLRGTTLDVYHGNLSGEKSTLYQWSRTDWDSVDQHPGNDNLHDFVAQAHMPRTLDPPPGFRFPFGRLRRPGAPPPVPPPPATQPADVWEQRITLKPTGTHVLFSIAGPLTFEPISRQLHTRYFRYEQVLETTQPLSETVEYLVTASNHVGGISRLPELATKREWLSQIDPQITAFARKPEVSGSNAAGPLAAQRNPLHPAANRALAGPDPLDAEIAANIEKYLKSHYTYTLDLTDTRQIEGRDPIVAFLYDFKKGHCEYFAGAMTLLCQSLGLQARMVVGFHCEPDSFVGGYYAVQQNSAHAWVEVLTTDGWKTFDPTSAIGAPQKRSSLWQEARNFFNFLDFSYAKSVIAYDGESQFNVMQGAQVRTLNIVISAFGMLEPLRRAVAHGGTARLFETIASADAFWSLLLYGFISLMLLCFVVAIGWFSWERYRLRRRASRIGIASLPIDEQMRLAKQLAFYDEMLQLLARSRIHRARHQTPLEFSRSLLFLPAEVYDTILRLTNLFYRVRYGRAELTPQRRKHLAVVLGRLGEELEGG